MFKPKNNSDELVAKTVQLQMDSKSEIKEEVKYRDPKGLLNPATQKIIKKEIFIRRISAIFWGVIWGLSVLAIILVVVLKSLDDPYSGIALYVVFSFLFLLSAFLTIKGLIRISGWKKTENSFRQSYAKGDAASSSMFVETFKNLSLKALRIKWIYFFFTTYFVLFNLIVFGLWSAKTLEIGTPPSQASGIHTNFYLSINFQEALDKAFGNVKTMLIIDLVVQLGLTGLLIAVLLYDKKRIQDIDLQLGSDDATAKLKELIQNRKKSENKAWLILYIIIFILVVLIPLAWMLYLVYRKMIRRKK
ncbi:MSC_0882 family membrane protein [Mycoplasma sp. 4013]